MKSDSGDTLSSWLATAELEHSPALTESTQADVCVVGAGISGLTTAYLLARENYSVVVLDDGRVGGGATCRTSAHLSNALDDRYIELEKLHGELGARLAAESHTAAIDRIERIVKDENISCDFRRVDGYLFVPPGDSVDPLLDELKACHRAGLAQVEMVERPPLNCYDFGAALRFPNQGEFHILKYIQGLARALIARGGRIFTSAHARVFEGGEAAFVETVGGHRVACKAIVVATNTPVNDRFVIHTKQHAYRSYLLGLRIPTHALPHLLMWDTPDPYHYVRVQSGNGQLDHDLLLVGGEDHKTGQHDNPAECFERLEAWARERFPMIQGVEYRWSGQIMEPVDYLAYIGRNPDDAENVYIITGDSGNGLTHGTLGAMIITDLISKRHNPWAELYDPSRVRFRAASTYIEENLNVAKQYARDYLSGGEVDSVDEIPLNSGALLRKDGQKVAVYKDEKGQVLELSAICRHLGGVVHWNDVEKTWDCPCHGARYTATGHVINGPSNANLEPLNGDD